MRTSTTFATKSKRWKSFSFKWVKPYKLIYFNHFHQDRTMWRNCKLAIYVTINDIKQVRLGDFSLHKVKIVFMGIELPKLS